MVEFQVGQKFAPGSEDLGAEELLLELRTHTERVSSDI